jgi:elongation factor G
VVLTDGASHAVDSSELAFKLAALYAFRQVQSCHHLVYIFYVLLVYNYFVNSSIVVR